LSPFDQNNQDEKNKKNSSPSPGAAPAKEKDFSIQVPSVSIPKGGGAIKNIDEQFQVNAANGTSTFSIPLPISKTRGDFAPSLSLTYNSGSGNGSFGLGWSCSYTAIQRRTDKKIPEYRDADESDFFQISGSEDLVPLLQPDGSGNWNLEEFTSAAGDTVRRYRPRIEGSYNRIERITPKNSLTFFWKVTSTNNVVTIFGKSPGAQIADPEDPERIFKWLPEFSFDDKGNCMQFAYLPEDLVNVPQQVNEQNRLNGKAGFSNAYLKNIQYGNTLPYTLDPSAAYNPLPPGNPQYLFEIVFDFGDQDPNLPTPVPQIPWPARLDPFSDYHAGFEIRTYRLCQRILFFHYFKELNDGQQPAPVLVRSLDLGYRYLNNPLATAQEKRNAEVDYIISIQQSGYKKNGAAYTKKTLPPFVFTYQEVNWNTDVQLISPDSDRNDPVGLGKNYQWLDLWSEGISGILTEQGSGWFYKSNLGGGHFTIAKPVVPKPSFTGLSDGTLQLQDLESDGRKFMLSLNGPAKGYFEITDEGSWLPFESFDLLPNIDLGDPNTKMIDLNGDGRADIIISDEHVFTWYPNQGKMGYDAAEYAPKPYDEEQGPALVFRDPVDSIFLADMSGDGLTDIVRIRNGECCYWPNMGYGKFGAKVNMNNAPVFDNPDLFNPAFIYLADVDGTGPADLLYLGRNGFTAWLNLSGNGCGDPVNIGDFPYSEPEDQLSVVDFLGNGTACIVWSSPLPRYQDAPLRYMDLMGGKKPYVISSYLNSMGKQVSCEYTSSTFYYLQDKISGHPWITKLPFPVQCVSKLMINDLAAGLYLSTQYSYHHGYYDHAEKEFRGFGRVEQTDSEEISNFKLSGANNVVSDELQQEPVKTITWFHTGAYIDLSRILNQFETEYNKGPFEFDLPAPLLPAGLSPIESREALRSCKGMMLRQEVYGLDGPPLQDIPYRVAKNTWQIRLLQPRSGQQYAVFFTYQCEGLDLNYERNLGDPRLVHKLNLEVDDTGHIQQSASVVYGRKLTDASLPLQVQTAQSKINIVYTVNSFTNSFDQATAYRLELPAETKTFELSGLAPSNGTAFTVSELLADFAAAALIDYEVSASLLTPQKRMIEDVMTTYLKNDLVTPLPLNQSDTLALPSQLYKMAFAPSLVTHLFGTRIAPADLSAAKYAQPDGTNWWLASGTSIYLRPLETVADAIQRFYLPVIAQDALGSQTKLFYDGYNLILNGTQDAMLNISTVERIDYRVLQPALLLDINQNTTEVLYDELGMVIVTSLYGKEGDGMHGDQPLSTYSIVQPSGLADVIANPLNFLQQATSFFFYDLDAWVNSASPVCFAAVSRQTHVSELSTGQHTKTFIIVGYTSGLGLNLQTKAQAEPGDALQWSGGTLNTVDTTPNLRWVGTGRTIFNNKGNPVKQYEPFFSTTYQYETEAALVEIGFSSILYYDTAGRNIRTEHPNGTYTRIEFDSWQQLSYDENDSVLDSPWYIALGSPNPGGPEPADPETRAAWLTASHANTPSQAHLDSLGRIIYTIANNGPAGNYSSLQVLDIENNALAMIDARNNTVIEYDYDMVNRPAHQHGMDNGDRWIFEDTMNHSVLDFTSNTDANGNSTDYLFQREYDLLHRPGNFWMTATNTGGSTKTLIGVNIYGENQPSDTTFNLRGKLFQQFDQSGLIQTGDYDFKGNIKSSTKQLASEYKLLNNWDLPDKTVLLDPIRIYKSSSLFDATNKPTLLVSPDGSKISPQYNDSNLLQAVNVFVQSQGTNLPLVQDIDYNAKGQRDRIVYGNNSSTGYTYEDTTYRLIRILTTRNKGADILQDLNYTFDPVGNITQVVDQAQQTIFFNNNGADPSSKFVYDAIYRLVHSWGREHTGQNAPASQFDSDKTQDGSGNRLISPGDIAAMQNYEELYQYDAASNIIEMIHNAGQGSLTNRWTMDFTMRASNNQLVSTQVSGNTTNYNYDLHGNMLNLLQGGFGLGWNYANQLQQMDLGGGGTAYYVYDNSGQRVRKVIETRGLTKERIYLGGYEVYHEIQGNSIQLERQTLHLMDDKKRVAMCETRTQGTDPGEAFVIRFQYGNLLGTACLELTGNPDPTNNAFIPAILSYEEYYPFGSTSYQAMDNQTETSKRYRYSGKERDEESGLYYYGARYYVPWLARWTATDPIGIADGLNIYLFVSNNPITQKDENGTDGSGGSTPDYHLHLDPDLMAKTAALLAENDKTTLTVTDPSGKVVSTSTTPNPTQGSGASSAQPPSGDAENKPLELKPPSFLATSIGQPWQAILKGLIVQEYNWTLGGAKALTNYDLSGGLNNWSGSVRVGYGDGKSGGDIGAVVGINATGSLVGGKGSGNSGGNLGIVWHHQIPIASGPPDFGIGWYLTPALQLGPDLAGGITGNLVFGQEPDKGSGWDAMITGSYFSKGQFGSPSSPLFANLWSLGGLVTWGKTEESPSKSNAWEVYANFYHGDTTSQSDGSAPASGSALRVGAGHNWQWNWKQGTEQYNGLGVYLGAAVEGSRIERQATGGQPSRLDYDASVLFFASVSIGGTRKR
jgi:RHS repeat-associated protein